MNRPTLIALGTLWVVGAVPHVRADRVHLVGGAVIEGKATRQGDKVVVEIESGELALSANEVQRIESSVSDVQRADAMYGKLAARYATPAARVDGLLEFANFCRDHGMNGREQMALQRVLELAPDHVQARARLGYVRADGTWIKREDQLRAQGLVEYEGKWITRAEMLQLERLRAEAETARHASDKAQAEARKAEAEAEQARAREIQAPAAAPSTSASIATTASAVPYAGYAWSPAYAPYREARPHCTRTRHGVCVDAEPRAAPARAAFPIAGVRDPFDYFR